MSLSSKNTKNTKIQDQIRFKKKKKNLAEVQNICIMGFQATGG